MGYSLKWIINMSKLTAETTKKFEYEQNSN